MHRTVRNGRRVRGVIGRLRWGGPFVGATLRQRQHARVRKLKKKKKWGRESTCEMALRWTVQNKSGLITQNARYLFLITFPSNNLAL